MPTIFIIDDDVELTSLLEEFLSDFNFKIEFKHNPVEALDFLTKNKVDLILLDIMLPEMDGFQVLRKIRESSDTPVMMLTAKGDVSDKVVGLEMGADDYLAKPFEPRELLARIQSILRRVSSSNSMVDVVVFEGLVVDKVKEAIELDGDPVSLSTSEFEALCLFVDNNNQVLDREFLDTGFNTRGI